MSDRSGGARISNIIGLAKCYNCKLKWKKVTQNLVNWDLVEIGSAK